MTHFLQLLLTVSTAPQRIKPIKIYSTRKVQGFNGGGWTLAHREECGESTLGIDIHRVDMHD